MMENAYYYFKEKLHDKKYRVKVLIFILKILHNQKLLDF